MNIQFCGANKEVTGSCHLLQVGTKNILIDCGMFQGSNYNEGKNHDNFPFDPHDIDVLLVTHAHLDHVGRIPKLVKDGFSGPMYMTEATAELMPLIWYDAWRIMVYNNRKYQTPILFEEVDIQEARTRIKTISYEQTFEFLPSITATFKDAGHIFGSSFIEISAQGKIVAFSGDIGNEDVPILKDTQTLGAIDYLVCESTYGDRIHETAEVRREIIRNLIVDGYKKGGTIMIPAFSLERTQELLYELHELAVHDKTLPKIPIYLDSPLAIDATEVYKKYPAYYDVEAMKHYARGEDMFHLDQLRVTYSKEDSKQINDVKGPKVVIAGAGMMNGGRIVHHALRYLSDRDSTLVLVGYQAVGTLGRKLYEGDERVQIFGQDVSVHCTVKAIGALSAHGDQLKLLQWMGSGKKMPEKVFFVHGEEHAATELSHRLRDTFDVMGIIPEYGETREL